MEPEGRGRLQTRTGRQGTCRVPRAALPQGGVRIAGRRKPDVSRVAAQSARERPMSGRRRCGSTVRGRDDDHRPLQKDAARGAPRHRARRRCACEFGGARGLRDECHVAPELGVHRTTRNCGTAPGCHGPKGVHQGAKLINRSNGGGRVRVRGGAERRVGGGVETSPH